MKLENIQDNPFIHKKVENGMVVTKYSRKCFYNNFWPSECLQARGHIYDEETGRMIVRPFDKIFNLGENKTKPKTKGPYFVQLKMNGFLGVVTKYKDKIIYSTTGSTTSDFAKYVQREIEKIPGLKESFWEGFTYLFEICIPEDPHIIPEKHGIYLLCRRHISTGICYPFPAELQKFKLNVPYYIMSNIEDLHKAQNVEGYVIWEPHIYHPTLKIKTTDYLVRKFIARGNAEKKAKIFDDQVNKFKVFDDEEMVPYVEYIRNNFTKEQFMNMSEQEILQALREFK